MAALGVVLVVFAVYSLVRTQSMVEALAFILAASSSSLDKADWVFHWRTHSYAMLILGAVFAAIGTSMFRRRSTSLAWLAVACAFVVVAELSLSAAGYWKYAFEEPGLGEPLFFGAVSFAASLAYWSQRARRQLR